jgi:hypothetical protein
MTDYPPPLPDHWVLQALQDLRADMRDQHRRIRDDMNKGFDALHEGIRGHAERLSDHSDRLITIETERKIEAANALKRGTWAGIAAASGVTVLINLAKWAFSR